MNNQNSENKLCPSSTCKTGNLLLGVVGAEAHVVILPEPIPLNEEFIKSVTDHGNPEKRFRFTGKCIKGGCKQWTGASCGVMKELSDANPELIADPSDLIECAVRPRCRWYSQDGPRACIICPFVITQGEVPVDEARPA